MRRNQTKPVVIANGASLSGAVSCEGQTLVGIQMPAAWTAAALTFQVATDSATGTFQDAYDDGGTEISVTAAASHFIPINTLAKQLRNVRFLKVRSGTGGVPVNQAAARTLVLVFADA